MGGGWSSGHITLAVRKQRWECCCSPGLHTWFAHLVCTPGLHTRLAHLACTPGLLIFSFLSSLRSRVVPPAFRMALPPLVHPLWKRPHDLTDALLECVFYKTANPDKVTKIKHHSVFWRFGLPFSNSSSPNLPPLLLWCVIICSAAPCETGCGSPPRL